MPSSAPSQPNEVPAALGSGTRRDERRLMGVVAGWLMLVAAAITLVGLVLPGADRSHAGIVLAAAALIGGYGLVCVLELIDWQRVSLRAHAWIAGGLVAVVGTVALWATGGAGGPAPGPFARSPSFVTRVFPPRGGRPPG